MRKTAFCNALNARQLRMRPKFLQISAAMQAAIGILCLLLQSFSNTIKMEIIKFIKEWTLPCAMVFGAAMYLLFTEIPPLAPVGEAVGPWFIEILPVLIFMTLYVTFCKIRLHDLRLRTWHVWMQVIRIAMAAALVVAVKSADDPTLRLALEGAFACVICPTASAAAVVTEKLGGSIASMTVYTLIDNAVTALLVPLLFPMIEKHAGLDFMSSFATILERTAVVLVLPFVFAMATRRWLPRMAKAIKDCRNLGFYFWAVNLSIVMGMTLHNIFTAGISSLSMAALILVPSVVTLLLFGTGKAVGRHFGDSVDGGQGLGQKNTGVGIWLVMVYLNPVVAIAPCAYVVWQNTLNSWQLWCMEKYGRLKW